MSENQVTYTFNQDEFKDTVAVEGLSDLQRTIEELNFNSGNILYINYNGLSETTYTIDFVFDNTLTPEEEALLTNLVSTYGYIVSYDTAIVLKDVKSAGTNGGDFEDDEWVTREINTMEGFVNFVKLSNNQFTLVPGSYLLLIRAVASGVKNHQSRLYNITDNQVEIMGSNAYSSSDDTSSEIYSILKLDEEKTFEVQHICSKKNNKTGRGRATGYSSEEVYLNIVIQKI